MRTALELVSFGYSDIFHRCKQPRSWIFTLDGLCVFSEWIFDWVVTKMSLLTEWIEDTCHTFRLPWSNIHRHHRSFYRSTSKCYHRDPLQGRKVAMKMELLTTLVFPLCPNPVRKTPCLPQPVRCHLLHRPLRHMLHLTPGVVTGQEGIREKVTVHLTICRKKGNRFMN